MRVSRPSETPTSGDVTVDRGSWLALATGSLAFVLGTINITVTNVGYDDIVGEFSDAGTSLTGWILTSYALAFATTMLLAGRLADRYGRLSVFRIGLGGLLVSSVVAGIAPNIEVLIAARSVQGICGALAVPSSLGLVLPRFPTSKHASVIGIWAAVGMTASGVAPLLAAAAISVASWRWMYLVLVPIAAAGLIGAHFFMHETADRDVSTRLDVIGVLMGSGSVFLVVFATLRGPAAGWSSPIVVGAFVISVVLMPLFLWRSAHHPEPLFDPRLFRIRSFAVSNLAVSLSMMGAFTSWILWPIFLLNVWGYTVWGVGFAFLASTTISGVVAVLGGRWADGHGYRGIMAVGAAVATIAHFWALFVLDGDARFWVAFFPVAMCFGLGMGVQASLLNAAALRDIPAASIATANGIHQALRYAMGGVGTALALAVLAGTYDVARFDVMWLILGLLQAAVVPLMWFGYPGRDAVAEPASTSPLTGGEEVRPAPA